MGTIMLMACIVLLCRGSNEIEIDRENNVVRSKRQISMVFSLLSQATSDLKEAYQNNELQTTGDVALTLVESIPILGDITSLFTEKPGGNSDVENLLGIIKSNLEILDKHIQSTGAAVEVLAKKIDLSVIENQVAADKREIYNCHEDFLLFLRNPFSKAEKDRLIICYSKFGYIRQIGSIMTDEEQTIMQKPLFEQIIDVNGYCNGAQITAVYKYLLGLYIEGCTSFVMSEVLKYNNNSFTYRDECIATIKTARRQLQALSNRCAKEPCSNFIPKMTAILQLTNITSIAQQLKETFPWFHFTVVFFDKNIQADLEVFDDKVNTLKLKSKAKVYRLLMWSQRKNSPNTGLSNYGLRYKENSVKSIYNGMNLQETVSNGLTSLMGYSGVDSSLFAACRKDVDVDTKRNIETKIKTFLTSNQDVQISLPGWGIATIAIVSVLIITAVTCYVCKRKGSCKCSCCDDY